MLAAKRLPEALKTILCDGLEVMILLYYNYITIILIIERVVV